MKPYRVVLFDADGVLIQPPERFSHTYAKSLGYNAHHFEPFFKGPFVAATLGQADLTDLVARHRDLWQWPGDPASLLQRWFQHEHVRNEPLLALVRQLRANGLPCYLATNQESHRSHYLKTAMFPGEFDGFFMSCELGLQKPDPAYFKAILHQLQRTHPGLQSADIVFFDDTPSHVAGASAIGINAHRYQNLDHTRQALGL